MDLTSLSAIALRQGLDAGTFTAVDLMAATLDRIEAVNPALNAIISLRPREELMAEARAADRAGRGVRWRSSSAHSREPCGTSVRCWRSRR